MERVLDVYKRPYDVAYPVVCMDEAPKQLMQETRPSRRVQCGKEADRWYPKAKKITLVMDNFSTHSPGALYEAFEPSEAKRIWDRFEFVYTPKHGSWLNMAEIELSVLNGQLYAGGSFHKGR